MSEAVRCKMTLSLREDSWEWWGLRPTESSTQGHGYTTRHFVQIRKSPPVGGHSLALVPMLVGRERAGSELSPVSPTPAPPCTCLCAGYNLHNCLWQPWPHL